MDILSDDQQPTTLKQKQKFVNISYVRWKDTQRNSFIEKSKRKKWYEIIEKDEYVTAWNKICKQKINEAYDNFISYREDGTDRC